MLSVNCDAMRARILSIASPRSLSTANPRLDTTNVHRHGDNQPQTPDDDDAYALITHTMFNDFDLLYCMLNFPEVNQEHPFALDYGTIANAQQNDVVLQQQADLFPDQYPRTDIGEGRTIIRFKPTPDCAQPKVYLPDSVGYSGQDRTLCGIQQRFMHPALS